MMQMSLLYHITMNRRHYWFLLLRLLFMLALALSQSSVAVANAWSSPSYNSCFDLECQNGGHCVSKPGQPASCDCPIGYAGPHCEKANPCYQSHNPCHPNGHCVSNNLDQFACNCFPGWTGRLCQQDVDECRLELDERPPCEHGGECINTPGSFQCRCQPGYTGVRCEKDVLECSEHPCQNGGQCVDKIGRYYCVCPPGFTGQHCEHQINHCSPNPCTNGGQCEDFPPHLHGTQSSNYACHCLHGWTGPQCEQRQGPCSRSLIPVDDHSPVVICLNNATCVEVDDDNFECQCQPGFSGKHCELDINDCVGVECHNGGYCVDLVNDWLCQCKEGFGGRRCEQVNSTIASSGTDTVASSTNDTSTVCERETSCSNNGLCQANGTSFECRCEKGFTGPTCSVNIYDCQSQSCGQHGLCLDSINSHRCECLRGVSGLQCEERRTTFDGNSVQGAMVRPSLTLDVDCSQHCDNMAQCDRIVDSSGANNNSRIECRCESAAGNFQGDHCEVDIDECIDRPCLNSGHCINTYGSFHCLCPQGFSGRQCQTPVSSKPSSSWCSNSTQPLCFNNGECLSHPLGFECRCRPGFTGPYCEIEMNECKSSPCNNDGQCLDLVNGYICICRDGFHGYNCSLKMGQVDDSCEMTGDCGPTSCSNGGQLVSITQGRRQCQCPIGFFGPTCQAHINLCSLATNVSSNDWSSSTFPLSNLFSSPTTHQLDPHLIGRALDQSVFNGLVSNNAVIDTRTTIGLCDPEGTRQCVPSIEWSVPGFTCVCRVDFTGPLCEQIIDPCQNFSCFNGGHCQSRLIASDNFNEELEGRPRLVASCQCPTEWSGSRCQFFVSREHESIDDNACSKQPCQGGGKCHLTSSRSFRCECPPGRAGSRCELDIKRPMCQLDGETYCTNNGFCLIDTLDNKPICKCDKGYCGDRCQLTIDACNRDSLTRFIKTSSAHRNEGVSDVAYNTLSIVKSWIGFVNESNTCEASDCQAKRDNSQCDPECNLLACDFDNLNCLTDESKGALSPTIIDDVLPAKSVQEGEQDKPTPAIPWKECQSIRQLNAACHLTFANGRCDKECASETCLFDGWDCSGIEADGEDAEDVAKEYDIDLDLFCPPGCVASYQDKKCQPECNISICEYDGGDCQSPFQQLNDLSDPTLANATTLPGTLILEVDLPVYQLFDATDGSLKIDEHFPVHRYSQKSPILVALLMRLTGLLRANVRLVGQLEDEQEIADSIQPTSLIESRRRSRRSVSIDDTDSRGSRLHLKLDRVNCVEGNACFHHVESAAQFLTASMLHKRHRRGNLFDHILTVKSTPSSRPPTPIDQSATSIKQQSAVVSLTVYIIVGLACGLVISFLAGVFLSNQCAFARLPGRQHSPSYQHQPSSSGHQFLLASYLKLIDSKRKNKKIQRARTWFPDNSLHSTKSSTAGHHIIGRKHSTNRSKLGHNRTASKVTCKDDDLAYYLGGGGPMAPNEYVETSQMLGKACSMDHSRQLNWYDANYKTKENHHVKPMDVSQHLPSADMNAFDYSNHNINVTFGGSVSRTSSSLPYASSDKPNPTPPTKTTNNDFIDIIGQMLTSSGLGPDVLTGSNINNELPSPNKTYPLTSSNAEMHLRQVIQALGQLDQDQPAFNYHHHHHHHQALFEEATTVDQQPNGYLTQFTLCRLPNTGETILHVAARMNHASSVNDLLDTGIVDPAVIDDSGRTPLMTAICSGALDSVQALLGHPMGGASNPLSYAPNFLTDSNTPLIQTVKMADMDLFRLVLHSMTALTCQLTTAAAAEAAATLTCSSSVTTNQISPNSSFGCSHYHNYHTQYNQHLSCCCCNSETFHPSDTPVSAIDYSSGSHHSMLTSKQSTAGLQASSSSPASTAAIQQQEGDNLLNLLDVNLVDGGGRSALHWAAVTSQPDMLACLLEAGSACDLQTLTLDETPLLLAAREGALTCCQLLLAAGANLDLVDYLDRSPRQLAESGGHAGLVQLFDLYANSTVSSSISNLAASAALLDKCKSVVAAGHLGLSSSRKATLFSSANHQQYESGRFKAHARAKPTVNSSSSISPPSRKANSTRAATLRSNHNHMSRSSTYTNDKRSCVKPESTTCAPLYQLSRMIQIDDSSSWGFDPASNNSGLLTNSTFDRPAQTSFFQSMNPYGNHHLSTDYNSSVSQLITNNLGPPTLSPPAVACKTSPPTTSNHLSADYASRSFKHQLTVSSPTTSIINAGGGIKTDSDSPKRWSSSPSEASPRQQLMPLLTTEGGHADSTSFYCKPEQFVNGNNDDNLFSGGEGLFKTNNDEAVAIGKLGSTSTDIPSFY